MAASLEMGSGVARGDDDFGGGDMNREAQPRRRRDVAAGARAGAGVAPLSGGALSVASPEAICGMACGGDDLARADVDWGFCPFYRWMQGKGAGAVQFLGGIDSLFLRGHHCVEGLGWHGGICWQRTGSDEQQRVTVDE